MATAPRFLFVGGNARSGTSALVRLLNIHRRVFLLMERHLRAFLDGTLRRGQYLRERVLGEARGLPFNVRGNAEACARKFDEAVWMGDKFPPIYRNFDLLDREFPEAEILYVVRNPVSVASSYEARLNDPADDWNRDMRAAVCDWNASVHAALDRLAAGRRLTVIGYEDLVYGEAAVPRLYGHLGLAPDEVEETRLQTWKRNARALTERPEPRNEALRRHVAMHADGPAYRRLIEQHALHLN